MNTVSAIAGRSRDLTTLQYSSVSMNREGSRGGNRSSQALLCLARNVRALRDYYSWSLAVFAIRAGVSKSMLKHIENRRANPAISEVLRIADGAGVSFSQLLAADLDWSELPLKAREGRRYPDADTIAGAIGKHVRTQRLVRNLSERDVESSGDISRTALRSVESGSVQPTTSTLERVAAALRMPLSALVEPVAAPVVRVVRADASRALAVGDAVRALFSVAGEFQTLEAGECQIERAEVSRVMTGSGSAIVMYMLAGELVIDVNGRRWQLKRGDAAVLESQRTFSFTYAGRPIARFLQFTTGRLPPGGNERTLPESPPSEYESD